MKQLKILGLAALAATALTAFLGAGTASATVFCSESKEPCPEAQIWPANTVFDFEIKGGTVARIANTNGGGLGDCQAGTAKGVISKEGSATETVKASIAKEDLTWAACNAQTKTEAAGFIEVHHIVGTNNGTVTASGFEIKRNIGLTECFYQTGFNAHLGALIGGKNPELAINAVLTKNAEASGFLCPATVKLTAEYVLKEPKPGGVLTPLYVQSE